jgi:hypothetical protein
VPLIGLPITVVGLVLGANDLQSPHRRAARIGVILCIIGLGLSLINAAVGAYLGATGQHGLINEFAK